MTSFTPPNMWARLFRPKRLSCRRRLWGTIQQRLKERGRNVRESGCFLLGIERDGTRVVKDFVLYDDIDPDCLRGGILFDGSKIDAVWKICREKQLQVVGDVHTHPMGFGQSGIDRANPMIPERGHLAIIIPNYADRLYLPGEIGMYEFLGRGRWADHSAKGERFFAVRRWM